MAKSTVYPISVSLNTLALSCGSVQFSSLVRSFSTMLLIFTCQNQGITLIIVHTQLYLHTKCPSAHNICAMLNIRLNFVHFLCSDMLLCVFMECVLLSIRLLADSFVSECSLAFKYTQEKNAEFCFIDFYFSLLLFQFPSRSLSLRLASPFSGFVYIMLPTFSHIFHLLSNRINIGILYGSPFFMYRVSYINSLDSYKSVPNRWCREWEKKPRSEEWWREKKTEREKTSKKKNGEKHI